MQPFNETQNPWQDSNPFPSAREKLFFAQQLFESHLPPIYGEMKIDYSIQMHSLSSLENPEEPICLIVNISAVDVAPVDGVSLQMFEDLFNRIIAQTQPQQDASYCNVTLERVNDDTDQMLIYADARFEYSV